MWSIQYFATAKTWNSDIVGAYLFSVFLYFHHTWIWINTTSEMYPDMQPIGKASAKYITKHNRSSANDGARTICTVVGCWRKLQESSNRFSRLVFKFFLHAP